MSEATSPILDGIRIAAPCQANWDAMAGTDRQRHCRECGHDVYDISALTTAAALELVHGPESLPCVRFYQRADGTIMTADCPVGLLAASRWHALKLAAAAAGVALYSAAVLAFGARRDPAEQAATSDEPAEAVVAGISTCFGYIKQVYGLPAPELMMGRPMRAVPVSTISAPTQGCTGPTTPPTALSLGSGAR